MPAVDNTISKDILVSCDLVLIHQLMNVYVDSILTLSTSTSTSYFFYLLEACHDLNLTTQLELGRHFCPLYTPTKVF